MDSVKSVRIPWRSLADALPLRPAARGELRRPWPAFHVATPRRAQSWSARRGHARLVAYHANSLVFFLSVLFVPAHRHGRGLRSVRTGAGLRMPRHPACAFAQDDSFGWRADTRLA